MAVDCNTPNAAQTNATTLSTAKVCDPTAQTEWTYWEPNEISDFSASLTKEARDPISQNRGGGKSTVTALEAAPGFSHDLTIDFFDYFMDDFLFTTWQGVSARRFDVSEITAGGFVVDTGDVLPEGAIIHTREFDDAANNGKHVVEAGSTATLIAVTGLTVDATPADGSQLYHVGHEFPAADIAIDADGNLTSTTTDFTTLGYVNDQWIDVRGFATQTGSTIARITDVTENLITLANSELTEEAATGITASIYVSQLAKTVSVDDPLFRVPDMTAEIRYNSATPEFEYGRRMIANQLTLNLPVAAKSTVDVTWSAADVEKPTTTRKLGNWFNTVNNASIAPAEASRRVAVDKVDETGLSTYLKDVTITLNNNAGGESVWGDLSATFKTFGNQTVESATEAVFIDGSVLRAARDNETVQLILSEFNAQGTVLFHQPQATWDEPAKNFERDNAVKVSGTIRSFTDPDGYRFSCSLFWYLPAV